MKFEVHIDVTMSGQVEIEAKTAEEAEKKAKEMSFVPSDLKNFYWMTTKVVGVD